MTIIIGIAINDKQFVLYSHRAKSAKPPLLQRMKSKFLNAVNSLFMPDFGVAPC